MTDSPLVVHSGMNRATSGAKSRADSPSAALMGSRKKHSLRRSTIAADFSLAIAYLIPCASRRKGESTLWLIVFSYRFRFLSMISAVTRGSFWSLEYRFNRAAGLAHRSSLICGCTDASTLSTRTGSKPKPSTPSLPDHKFNAQVAFAGRRRVAHGHRLVLERLISQRRYLSSA